MSRTYVNLEGALFVPLYATPKSTPDALNIVFKGDKSHESAISLSFLKLQGRESKTRVLGIFHCLLTKSNSDLLDFQQAVSGYKVVYDKLAGMTNFLGMDHLIFLQEGYQNSYVYSHRVVAWQTEIRARESANMVSKAARAFSAESGSSCREFTRSISQRIISTLYCPIINKELHNFSHVSYSTYNG